jgi:ATP-dependent RNA helicase SUPV3L1/SUV3
VPLDRRHEQKLWDAFRAPIDEAFNRKTAEREKASAAMSEHDRHVLDASKALDAANAGGDVQKIRAAVARLEGALRGEAPPPAPAEPAAGRTTESRNPTVRRSARPKSWRPARPPPNSPKAPSRRRSPSDAEASPGRTGRSTQPAAPLTSWPRPMAPTPPHAPMAQRTTPAKPPLSKAAPAAAPKPAPKPVVAMRGDDRPSSKKAEAAPAGRAGGKFGDRRDGGRPARRSGPSWRPWRVRAPRTVTIAAVIAAHRPAASATVPRASKTAARAWAMPLSAPSAKRSSARTWRCASSRRRPTAKR